MATTEHQSMFREMRAARNQSLFREVNERIEGLTTGFSLINPQNDFICECANDTCIEQIPMTIEEYETVRKTPNHFMVAPSDEHVWPDVERILEKTERYWIVEKTGGSGVAAAKVDPRS